MPDKLPTASLTTLTVLTLALLSACDEEAPLDDAELESAEVISFDDYKHLHTEQTPDGRWIVEDDIVLEDEQAVRDYYDVHVAAEACEQSDSCPRSTVHQFNGHDAVWSAHRKLSLTYCIDDMGSTTTYNRVKASLENAARDWETSADINFIHLSGEDGSGCEPGTNGVLFRVTRDTGCSGTLLAHAFFPTWTSRELVYCSNGLSQSDSELLSTTKHELGHVLGLVHEHYRWSQDEEKCSNGSSSPRRNVTYADDFSIMGYDFCDGMESGGNTLSRGDRIGIGRLYNIARNHGRLSGNAFHRANSFLGTGVSDDIFWYVPGGSQYELWATSTSSTIGFTKYTNNYSMDDMWRPMGVQWVSNGDANYNREVLFFGPGAHIDRRLTNNNNGTFSASNLTINGWYIPMVGKFHGGTYDEILWWNPGSGSLLWRMDGSGNITQTSAVTSYGGDPSYPLDFAEKTLTGSFGLGSSDPTQILWYGGCYGYVTRGTGSSGFESYIVDMLYVTGTCSQEQRIPLLGDFDGDSKGDIFWYGPGSVADRLVLNRGDDLYESYSNYIYSAHNLPVNGHYKPLVGDFNGDSNSDIFWYQPGTGGDSVWLFTGAGTYSSVSATVNGDYAPIPGDFNNDGCADIVWFDGPSDRLLIWRSDCDGTFTAQTTQTDVPVNAYPVGYGIGY